MLLRRVMEHVDKQNWAAVALDFVIVVLGVFIGLQLGNWNENRQIQAAFAEANERLLAESRANLATTDAFLTDVEARMAIAREAISALRTCETSEVAHQQIVAGANAIRGTPTLHLRQTALSAITANDAFLSLFADETRERLKEFERRLKQSQSTLDWLEDRPFTNHIEDADYVTYSELVPVPAANGILFRTLTIESPLDQICTDPGFTSPFYLWERTSTFQSLRAQQIKTWLTENIEEMEAR